MVTRVPNRRWRWAGVLSLALIAAALGVLGASAAAAEVRLATQDPHAELQVRPAIVYYTGDGTGFLSGTDPTPAKNGAGGIDWVVWNGTRGFGHGFNWVNDCRPDCADGHFQRYAAAIRVRRPRGGIFTRMTIVFHYNGRRAYDHRILERAAGNYYWGICGSRYTKPC